MKYLKHFENNEIKDTKILFLAYLINRNTNSNKWKICIDTFNNLDIDWWVKPQGASHLGLAYQSILNTDDLDKAIEISEYIESQFDIPILICLSKEIVSNHEPVGESNDSAWWKIGRTFDKMVSEDEKGIHIIN